VVLDLRVAFDDGVEQGLTHVNQYTVAVYGSPMGLRTALLCVLCCACASGVDSQNNELDATLDGPSVDAADAADAVEEWDRLTGYCCEQSALQQTCTLQYNPWSCVPDPSQPTSYPCTTPLCGEGQYCIGLNGPGTVIFCP